MEGGFDEIALWPRALSATEVQELYRRGANRVKYQVRSCAQADCSDAEFMGPGGDGTTYYSELFNRSSSDMDFSCDADDLCTADEISLSGSPLSGPSRFDFSDMAINAIPNEKRYFQYRVIMEAEENSACDNKACLPELSSVKVGPENRYYGQTQVISSNTPLSLSTIESMNFEEGGRL